MPEQDHSALAGEGGFSLIEMLIAMMVIGIAFVGLLTGMATTTASAAVHRTQAVAELELRRYAELVDAEPFSASGLYTRVEETDPSRSNPGVVGFTVLNSAVFPYVAVAPSCVGASSGVTCTTADRTQIVTIGVQSTDGRVDEEIQIVKRAS
jgi:prepilin-type N-terminal cleavage/methylation domain-containing protein